MELSEEQIRSYLDNLYRQFPKLKDYVPTEGLEMCCQRGEVADLWGWAAAEAWEQIQGWRWLLGEE